jgi:Flp pilus assembly protein TadB
MAVFIVVFGAFAMGAAVILGGYFGVTKLPGLMMQRKLEGRLLELSQEPEEQTKKSSLLLKVQHVGPMPALDRAIGGTVRGSAIGRWIDQSGVKASISGVVLVAILSAIVVGLVAGLVSHMRWGFIGGGIVGFMIPFIVLKVKRTRRLRDFEEQLP